MFCPVIQRYSWRLSMYIKLSFGGVTLKGFNLGVGGEGVYFWLRLCLFGEFCLLKRENERPSSPLPAVMRYLPLTLFFPPQHIPHDTTASSDAKCLLECSFTHFFILLALNEHLLCARHHPGDSVEPVLVEPTASGCRQTLVRESHK